MKFKEKYRTESLRLKNWDYSNPGFYFVTICSKNNECYFGEIINLAPVLNQVGVIADILWHEIPKHFDFVELGNFIVMPNHVHGIVFIKENSLNHIENPIEETRHALSPLIQK